MRTAEEARLRRLAAEATVKALRAEADRCLAAAYFYLPFMSVYYHTGRLPRPLPRLPKELR